MRFLTVLAAIGIGLAPLTVLPPGLAQAQQTDAKAVWEKITGSWNQTKGAVKEEWGKLTDDDLLTIEGRREHLVGKIQTRYGITKEEAEAQVGAWEKKRM